MSLFRSAVRTPAPPSAKAVEHHVSALGRSIGPDPLYRRRLRGHVLNRYVAGLEGPPPRRAPRNGMTRMGRAALFASFALALSVTGVMAAAEQALPGSVLYPVKMEIEELRLRALPEHLHDELAAHAFAERISELVRMATGGDADAVAAQLNAVRDARARVLELGGSADGTSDLLSVASGLMHRLPHGPRDALETILADLPQAGPVHHHGSSGSGDDPASLPRAPAATGDPSDAAPGGEADRPAAAPPQDPRPTHAGQPEPEPPESAPPRPTPPPQGGAPTQPPHGQPAPRDPGRTEPPASPPRS